jgi:quercetin dioxygenase-like cupin family protein
MAAEIGNRILDFGKAGMWWEITRSTADTNGDYFEAVNVVNAGFGGPPVHAHPTAEETYAVTEGELDVCVAGTWRKLKAGESATVPAGVPHTLKNSSAADVRLINTHKPALEFERFFRRMHAMIAADELALPPRGLGHLLRIAMLFNDHPQEIISVKPPRAVIRVLAAVGKTLGYKLPRGE